jgi:hypothetical protein
MERCALWLWNFKALEQRRDRGGNRIRIQWRPIGIREDQVEVIPVIRTELRLELVLALPMRFQCGERGRGQGSCYGNAAVFNILPSKREDLATTGTKSSING